MAWGSLVPDDEFARVRASLPPTHPLYRDWRDQEARTAKQSGSYQPAPAPAPLGMSLADRFEQGKPLELGKFALAANKHLGEGITGGLADFATAPGKALRGDMPLAVDKDGNIDPLGNPEMNASAANFALNMAGIGGASHFALGMGERGPMLGMNAPVKIAQESAAPAGRQRLVASMYDPATKRNILGDPTDTHGSLAAKNYDVLGHPDDMGFTNSVTGERMGRSDAMSWLKQNDPDAYAAYGPYANSGRLEAQKYNNAFDISRPPLKGMSLTAEIPGFGSLAVGPNQRARAAASGYMKKAGLKYDPPDEYVPVDPQRAARVADEFERMPHNPNDPEVAASYGALTKEVGDQWKEIEKTGLKVEFIKPGMEDPYKASPRLANKDIAENNHLWVFPTEYGFGDELFAKYSKDAPHPMLQDSGVVVDGRKLQNNDLFRIVHDYFGHAKEGVGFRATGEDNAFRQHRSMFTPLAQRALTTETRGQNSWLNYGPHGAKNRTAKGDDTVFADQKVGLMPEWTTLYANSKNAAPLSLAAGAARGENAPMRMYHGSSSETPINEFRVPNDHRTSGVWLTPSKQYAARYGSRGFKTEGTGVAVGKDKRHVVPVDADFKNPIDLRDKGARDKWIKAGKEFDGEGGAAALAKSLGHDAVIFSNGEYLAVGRGTLKSAIDGSTLFANNKKAAPLSMAASLENDFPFDNPNAKNVGKPSHDPMSYTNAGGMPLKTPQMPLGFTGSFDATKNAPFTMGGKHPHEWTPEEFKRVGDAFGVERLGPLSPEQEFPYKEGGSFTVPGGLDGKFTYYDMLSMKNNPINPERIDEGLHAQIQKKMTRSMMPDEGDVSQSQLLSGLNFGMTSPGNPLFSNQLAMSRLRVNSVEDLDRLANSVPWKFGDDVSKEMRHKHNIEIAKKYGIGAADEGGGGGLGVRGNADYTRVAEMAQMFKQNPEWFRRRADEPWHQFAERVFTQVPGMAAKTGSFGVVWQNPVEAAVSAIDRHMSKKFKDKFLDTPEKKAAWENRVLNLYNKKLEAKGKPPMKDITELSDNDLGYELLQELGKTKKSNFRTPNGEIGKGVPEHMRDEQWIMEPKQATVMGTSYKKALQANVEEAAKHGLGLFESQWHIWDRIRRRLEPHENMFPGLEKMPRMSVDQLKRVDATHAKSGHKSSTKVKMEDGSVRLKPTQFMDNPADFAYFSNPGSLAPFSLAAGARREDQPRRGR
jgi:hypothetical protein